MNKRQPLRGVAFLCNLTKKFSLTCECCYGIIKVLGWPTLDTSARISFFQEFQEFLIKSLHLRVSRGFPLIGRLINDCWEPNSHKTPHMATFCSIQRPLNSLSILPKRAYAAKFFNLANYFQSFFPHQSLFLPLKPSLPHFFCPLGFLSLALKIAVCKAH